MIGPSVSKHKSSRLRRYVALLALVCVLLTVLTWARSAVGGEERSLEKYAVRRVLAAYPPYAQRYKIEGTVTVQVTVGPNGKVSSAEFIRGNNLFRNASLDAAKRWEFKLPGAESNQGMIHFTFKLSE